MIQKKKKSNQPRVKWLELRLTNTCFTAHTMEMEGRKIIKLGHLRIGGLTQKKKNACCLSLYVKTLHTGTYRLHTAM